MTRYAARWVIPVETPPIADGEVEVTDGRIAYVGPRRHDLGRGLDDLGDAIIVPGLVNTHTHLELTAMRGFLEELAFQPWIARLTRARRAVLSADVLQASARLGIGEGFLAGITTFADTSESGVVLDAMREMGARGVVFQEVFGPDPAQCDGAVAALRAQVERLGARTTALTAVGVSPHAPYSVSDALFRAVSEWALASSLPMAIHVAESEEESSLVRDGQGAFGDVLRARGIGVAPRGATPIALLERTGALAPRPLLIHCVRADDGDIARLAAHDCAVAHCPASNAKLGHGVAPLVAMRRAGIRVGLGSDSVAANNRMDLLDEARLAALLQRAHERRPDLLPAGELLELATLGGARALAMDATIGSLAEGKGADLAAFSLGDLRASPAFAPEDALVWALAGRPAARVLVAGREVVRDGSLVADLAEDRACVAAAAGALAQWHRAHRAPP